MTHPLNVVLAGCGGISRAWLEAIRDIPDIRMVGFVDIDESAARSRAEQFGWTEAAVGDRSVRHVDSHAPRCGLRLHHPGGAHPDHAGGAAPRLPRARREAAGRLDGARARDGRRSAGSGQNLRRHPEPPLRSEHPPAARLPRIRRHRRDHHRQLRFLHRRALRRLPRPHGARAAARHGDPHLRRGAADLRRGRDRGLLPRVEPGRLLVRSRRVGRGDLRDDRGDRLHLPRQLVRRGAADDVGVRLADRRHEGQREVGRRDRLPGPGRGRDGRLHVEDAGSRAASLRRPRQDRRARRRDP